MDLKRDRARKVQALVCKCWELVVENPPSMAVTRTALAEESSALHICQV